VTRREAWRANHRLDISGPRCAPRPLGPQPAALASIDAIYAIEHVNAYNADVASPIAVQEFWEKHGELPGFAVGT